MIRRMLPPHRLLCALPLLALAPSAEAGQRKPIPGVGDFDLARDVSSHEDERRFRLDSDAGRRFPKESLGPQWSYNPLRGGPSLEVAALGAGRKGSPKLAHVRVDWSF